MAAQKHLHELLKEDQEPFHLNTYIADRRCLLKKSNPPKTTSLQVKKRRPIVETSSTIPKRSLCKQACFFAFHDSPDVTKSPLPKFLSPAKSPCRNQNGTVLLQIPAKTATLLLEASMRIQKQQSSSHSKSKPQIKNVGFGLFSSILKKLKDRSRNKKCEIRDRETKNPRKSEAIMEENIDARTANEVVGFSCYFNNSRLSSAGWSESNEERSLDMETSTSSSQSEDSEELDYVTHKNGAFTPCEMRFCSSPVSPFRFSLQRSPSSGRRTPIFTSPAASPRRHKREDKENYEANDLEKIQVEEDDEKEQCSPVSVLDPPFDNEEEEEGHESGDDEDEDYDVEGSFAIVQRAKEQLLYKLRRFEKLAELDPIELEKRMMEQLEDEDDEQSEDNEFYPAYRTCNLDSFVNDVFNKSDLLSPRKKVPADMKRLVTDLISEENSEMKGFGSNEIVLGKVCKKLDSWKEVESNTIDMMVESDFKSELDHWKRCQEQREETAMEIALAIFGLLVEELTEELK